MKDWIVAAGRECGVKTEAPFPFAPHASVGCGGYARAAFFPEDVAQTLAVTDFLRREEIPFYVLGNMTDVLPPDGLYDGALVFTAALSSVGIGRTVFALAGVKSGALLDACARHGKTGAEFLAGIPCTVGGAVFMNAGAFGRRISDILESALVCRDGRLCVLSAAECGYGYKESVFMRDGSVILGASFALGDADGKTAEEKRARALAMRARLPQGKSMGCVFKNPPGMVAGRLIEGAGLKGLRVGGAVISPLHANFIVNDAGATSADIRALVNVAKNAVLAQYGVALEEEIRYIV